MLTVARRLTTPESCRMTTSTLAERLQKALDHAGLTMAQLEVEAELGKGFLSRPLAGERKTMNVEFQKRIARVCGVSFLWLSTGDGPMRGSGDEPPPSEPETEASDEDTSPLVRALFRVMDPDKFAEQDFKSARRALVETFAYSKDGEPVDTRARQALVAAKSLRLEGLLVTNAGILSRVAWGKPDATLAKQRAEHEAANLADVKKRAK